MAPDRPQVDKVNTVCHYCQYRGASHPDQELLTLAGVSGDASECASRLFTLESKHRKRKLGQYFVATKVVRFSPAAHRRHGVLRQSSVSPAMPARSRLVGNPSTFWVQEVPSRNSCPTLSSSSPERQVAKLPRGLVRATVRGSPLGKGMFLLRF